MGVCRNDEIKELVNKSIGGATGKPGVLLLNEVKKVKVSPINT